jgi:hypothetical protein
VQGLKQKGLDAYDLRPCGCKRTEAEVAQSWGWTNSLWCSNCHSIVEKLAEEEEEELDLAFDMSVTEDDEGFIDTYRLIKFRKLEF